MLSIIIPTYNSAATLPYLLDSVLSQSYLNYEIIIVDGGSRDNTRQIVSQVKKRINSSDYPISISFSAYGRNRPFMQKNIGSAMASGKVLLFLNPDIVLGGPNFLYNMMREFESKDLAGLTCSLRQKPAILGVIHDISMGSFLSLVSKSGFPVSRSEVQFVKSSHFFKARGFKYVNGFIDSVYFADSLSAYGRMAYTGRKVFSSAKIYKRQGFVNSVIVWPFCYLLYFVIKRHMQRIF